MAESKVVLVNMNLLVKEPELIDFNVELDHNYVILLPTLDNYQVIYALNIYEVENKTVCQISQNKNYINCTNEGTTKVKATYQVDAIDKEGEFNVQV